MSSGLHRKRFIRELESLKIVAHYSAVDESNLDQLLMSLSPELSVYTYEVFLLYDLCTIHQVELAKKPRFNAVLWS
ncbi:GPI-anchored mannoprotein [Parelaphostrongylus tenuis]|uniref:GPI-anchored mannoprotein n=1 Tax=Parelaphostrongylus tenuis TaxID=148309 RepID=A0AAD5WH35_PARTN|nr:GPI-anchored mannoprotein [Parelaphostrongylus tenuis]KAJ1368289.1 GPI-anchored mannoprotein [Parelaphostrongylus tenuis]KAJ1369308.1 GPI-anchored mannoprotein [Parelaphostrongylus tenuis]